MLGTALKKTDTGSEKPLCLNTMPWRKEWQRQN